MGFTTRDLAPDDAEDIAALMARVEADHPTGFCLGAVEIREIMNGHGAAVFEGAFDGRDMVAYTTVMAGKPGAEGQKLFLYGDVDPSRLGEGLGTLMLTRSLDRARAMHSAAAPGAPARYAATALAGRPDQADLMTATGFHPGRHAFLNKLFLYGDVDPSRLGEGLGTLMLTRSLDRALHDQGSRNDR